MFKSHIVDYTPAPLATSFFSAEQTVLLLGRWKGWRSHGKYTAANIALCIQTAAQKIEKSNWRQKAMSELYKKAPPTELNGPNLKPLYCIKHA